MTELPTAPTIRPQRQLIDGEWSELSVRLDESIQDSRDGTDAAPQVASTPADIDAAISAAWRVHQSGEWRNLPVDERADALERLADALEPAATGIAAHESVTTGATIGATSMLTFIVHASFRLAADQLRSGVLNRTLDGPTGRAVEIERRPWGPALLLCPWNAPAPMAAHKLASALAAGCPAIIKPPERAPLGTELMVEALHDSGLPAGVLQLVAGGPDQAGQMLHDDRVRAVSFTGGIAGGRAVAHACAEGLKPAQLELGGHSPLVVMPDADPAAVAAAVVALLTTLNGQWCRALGRLLLPADRSDELFSAILDALSAVNIGDPLDPESHMGPIVHSGHLALLTSTIGNFVSNGAAAHESTPLPDRPGNWLAPTLITGAAPETTVDEVFGPIAFAHTYSDLNEAIELANGTRYGLEAYVVGADEDSAMSVARRVNAGGVKVNGVSPMSLHLMAPRPACGISGLHDEGTVETIEFFGGPRVVGVEGQF